MEETRSMDTADRFVNCKCVKYQLRVNDVDMAITNAGMFTRVRSCIIIVLPIVFQLCIRYAILFLRVLLK